MVRRVETRDAQNALGAAIRAEVERAAGGNDLVSRSEAKSLQDFVRRAEAELRAEKPAGARIHADELVDRAMRNAMRIWDQFNPPGQGQDSRYLSQEEIKRITALDPELGALTKAAYLTAAGALGGGGNAAAIAVRNAIEGLQQAGRTFRRENPTGAVIDARVGQPGRENIPVHVLESFDHYFRAEAAAWGSATLKSMQLGGRDVYSVHLGTGREDGYVEIFSKNGDPLVSAQFRDDDLDRWDEFFGLGRFAGRLGVVGAQPAEGYSEDETRADAGQILSTWEPAVVIDRGMIDHDAMSVTGIRTDIPLTPEQRELARAALELMFTRTFVHALAGDPEPMELGRRRAGDLRIGEHTNPHTGQRYLVADWRDIDDASFTLYFQRTPSGVLKLKIEQFNN